MSLGKSILAAAVAVSFVGMLPAIGSAQEQPMVEVPTSMNTALGEISGTSVNVRSGPAESYYPTMQLNKGDRVTVVGHKFDWLKIVPPEGSFSYIAKIYIDRDGAGSTGKVNRDGVLVRAGSSLNQLKVQSQTTLNTGAPVEIIGEADEFYKIKPPEGAYLFVKKDFVNLVATAASQPAGGGVATAAGAGAAATAVEAAPPPQPERKPTVRESTKEETKPEAKATASTDGEIEFRKLEQQFEQAKEQPLENRPFDEMLKGYQALLKRTDLSSTTRRMADFRVQYLEAVLPQQQELLKAKQNEEDFKVRQAALEAAAKQIEQRMQDAGIAVYTAVGQLAPSTIQREGQPLMRLVDPADNRTLVYLNLVDPKQRAMVGTYIGVNGEVVADSNLGINIIDPTLVQQVDQSRVLKGVTAKIYPPSLTRGAE